VARDRAELAIVIPAYKSKYLKETFSSIAAQTDKRFRVYVGDDASPDPIEDVVRESGLYPNQLVYKRFQENLGSKSLVAHWRRCIELSTEPWVWLFSDDDLMSPGCIASFYRALEETSSRYDLYRFNTAIIDEKGEIVDLNPPHPRWEPWYQFAYFLFKNYRLGNQQELIFKRSAFDAVGGFQEFPLAWWSDIAFVITCGTRHGIYTIENERIFMRKSGDNISSIRDETIYRLKLYAMASFFEWVAGHIEGNDCGEFPGKKRLLRLARDSFYWRLKTRNSWITFQDFSFLYARLNRCFGVPFLEFLFRVIYYNAAHVFEKVFKIRGSLISFATLSGKRRIHAK